MPRSAHHPPAALLALLLALPGCPYLWGPPDYGDEELTLYSPGEGDADADADADADTDADADAPPQPPIVEAFEVGHLWDEAELRFTASDADGDLDGGRVLVQQGAAVIDVYLLSELPGWDGAHGTVTLPQTVGCAGLSLDYTIVVADAAKHSSADASSELVVQTFEEGTVDTPLVTAPAVLCGEHSPASDLDFWDLQFTEGGAFTVFVDALDGTGEEVRLLDDIGAVLLRTDDELAPASFTYTFAAGETYHLVVAQLTSGSGNNYIVEIGR